jgi:hypothetical protein
MSVTGGLSSLMLGKRQLHEDQAAPFVGIKGVTCRRKTFEGHE